MPCCKPGQQDAVRAPKQTDDCIELSARVPAPAFGRARAPTNRATSAVPHVLGTTETGRRTLEAGHLDLPVPQVTCLELGLD